MSIKQEPTTAQTQSAESTPAQVLYETPRSESESSDSKPAEVFALTQPAISTSTDDGINTSTTSEGCTEKVARISPRSDSEPSAFPGRPDTSTSDQG